jgi:seryl-tRNA synthetase
MKALTLLLALFLLSFSFNPDAFAQRVDSDHRDLHRDVNQLETELLNCLQSKEGLLSDWEKRNNELREVHAQRNRADGQAKEKLDVKVDILNHQNRQASIQLQRIDTEIQRINLGLDKLTRYDLHLIEDEGKQGNRGPKRLVVSFKNLKFSRRGPVRIQGKGLGYEDITTYEFQFNDGSKQQFEEKSFTPVRP